MKIQIIAATVMASVALADASIAQNAGSAAVPADNTRSNKEDSNRNPTSDEQKNDGSDLKITQHIRQSVIADKNLSINAHNAKIVSLNGTVTLNGVVDTDAERNTVAQKAAKVVGESHVVNNLKVTAAK